MPAPRKNIKRECTHGGRHRHGMRAMYSADKCRCTECADAVSNRDAEIRRLKAFGRWEEPFVDAEPARLHVRALKAQGMGRERIAQVSGVPHAVIAQLLYDYKERPRTVKLRRDNAEALLGTPLTRAATIGVDATGTKRRMQALMVAGWSAPALARKLGLSAARVEQIMRAQKVTPATVAVIRDLYERLWQTPPPETNTREKQSASRLRNLAASKGFAPAMSWDDDTIDDPNASPISGEKPGDDAPYLDEIAIEEALSGRAVYLTRSERSEAVRRLTDAGYSTDQISRRLRTNARDVQRRRAEHRKEAAA